MHRTSSILFAYHSFSCGKQLVLRWQSQGFGTLCCLRVTRLFVYIMRSYVVEYSSYMSHVMVGVPKLVQIALLLNCSERCLVSTVMDWRLSMWLGLFLCRRFQPGQVSCSNTLIRLHSEPRVFSDLCIFLVGGKRNYTFRTSSSLLSVESFLTVVDCLWNFVSAYEVVSRTSNRFGPSTRDVSAMCGPSSAGRA